MRDFEFHKWATSFLLSALIIVMISNLVDVLYDPEHGVTGSYHVNAPAADSPATSAKSEQPLTFDIVKLMSTADVGKGKVVAKKCAACHTFNKGDHNRVGPNLWNIVDRGKAQISDFNYSKAMLSKGGSWGYDELFTFLHKPQAYVKGTRMAFVGITKPEELADLVAYLRSLSDNPVALPK